MTTPVTLLASASRTADGVGASLDCAAYGTLRLTLSATRPNVGYLRDIVFKVWLETSSDDATWRTVHTFAVRPHGEEPFPNSGLPDPRATQTERVALSNLDRYVRAKWVCHDATSGVAEASMTFGIAGDAL